MTLFDSEAEAALHRQSPPVQWLLLSTSILDQLCGSLCDTVSGQGDSAFQLQQLATHETFLTQNSDWFIVHRKYADVWRNRLFHSHFDQLNTLHRRASGWYAHNDDPAQAIRHSLAGDDELGAAELILREGAKQNHLGNFQVTLDWLAALPDPLVRQSARICLLHAEALLLGGHPRPAAHRLTAAQIAPDCGPIEHNEIARLSALLK
jgi:LuxR family transcriptional regulator, maltose regulon positive regulatory protein